MEKDSDFEDRFSNVGGDPWHGMDRPKVPMRHCMKRPYFQALCDAFFLFDEDDWAKVVEVLKTKHNWDNARIEAELAFNFGYFAKRVRRIIPKPSVLYRCVKAVFLMYRNKRDPKTNQPVFNQQA